MTLFLAFSKSLIFPPYCYACDEPLAKSLFFCDVCQSQMEFLQEQGRCIICFDTRVSKHKTCSTCQNTRLYDKKICLFDSLSPIVALTNRTLFIRALACLFILGLDHFSLDTPKIVLAEDPFYKKIAKEMMNLIRHESIHINSVLIIGKDHVSEHFLEKVAKCRAESLNLAFLCC